MKRTISLFLTLAIMLGLLAGMQIPVFASDASDFTFTVNSDGSTVTVTGYNGSDTMVTIPSQLDGKNVTVIGANAFASGVTAVSLPSTATTIGDNAFASCDTLVSITIPSSVKTIGANAFSGVTLHHVIYGSLAMLWKTISIAEGNDTLATTTFHYSSTDSILESTVSDGKAVMKCLSCGAECGEAPETDVSYFTYEVVDESYIRVTDCEDISGTLVVPAEIEGLPVQELADDSLKSLNATAIVVPDTVKTIGNYAFGRCDKLVTAILPDGLISLGSEVFNGCVSLTTANIPETVTSIGSGAFRNCRSLTNIVLPNGITTIQPYTFVNCQSLTEINIHDGIYRIGKNAFAGCTGLTSLELPASQFIEAYAFSVCSALTSVTFGDVRDIGDYAFAGCSALESIDFPETLALGNGVLMSCRNLKSVTLPTQLYSLPESTFANCASLETVTLPATLTTIGKGAFYNCTSLAMIVLPEGTTAIDGTAFSTCLNLQAVVFPASIASVGANAFLNCNVLEHVVYEGTADQWALSISFAEGNTSVTEVDALHLESDASILSYDAETGKVSCLECENDPPAPAPEDIDFIYTINGGEVTINAYTGTSTMVFIPSEIEGLPVTAIIDGAFAGMTDIQSIHIPSSVQSIGDWAFFGCSSLVYAHIPNGVEALGDYLFSGCTSLKELSIPVTVKSIGEAALTTDNPLTHILYEGIASDWSTITLGDGVEIPNCTIHYDMNAEYAYMDGTCTRTMANDGTITLKCAACGSITEIESIVGTYGDFTYGVLDNGIVTITKYNGSGNYSVTIPAEIDGLPVGAIGAGAFAGDQTVTNLTVKATNLEIQEGAFADSVLKHIICAPGCSVTSTDETATAATKHINPDHEILIGLLDSGTTIDYCCSTCYTVLYTETKPLSPGDVNGDYTVDNRDITLYLRSMAGWEVEMQFSVADVNADGSFDNRDITTLLRYMAGWEVELLPNKSPEE